MKDEFIGKIETLFKDVPLSWVHFEGRNVEEAVKQIDWLDNKARQEGWRSQLRISVELEKPDRPHIDTLLNKVI
jgi:ketohexokinase